MLKRQLVKNIGSIMLLLVCASLVQASYIVTGTASGVSGGISRSASISFQQVDASGNESASGDRLKVTLQNTSSVGVNDPKAILSAVFFDINPSVTLTPLSAFMSSGSTAVMLGGTPPTPPGGNVGGEWFFNPNLSGGLPKYGIGSSGLDNSFGSGDPDFNGDPLGGGLSGTPPDGLAWGLIGTGGVNGFGSSPNGGVQNRPFVKSSIEFTFTGWTPLNETNFSNMFSNVRFQYGTALDEGNLTTMNAPPPVPVPAGVILFGIGGAIMTAGSCLRRRRAGKLA